MTSRHNCRAGQFFQTVYPPAWGSNFDWAFGDHMHLSDACEFSTDQHRDQLYAEWRRYWDVSRPILVDKSPRHIIMSRLLQHWYTTTRSIWEPALLKCRRFTPERTAFMFILRHPLGTMRENWEMTGRYSFGACGESALVHWLTIHEAWLQDLAYISHFVVFHFERLVLGDSVGAWPSSYNRFAAHCVHARSLLQRHA